MAGIYLHIPFCKSRCSYCDFYSTTASGESDRFIEALCRELENRKKFLSNEPVETLYLGGGTPSQLQERELTRLFETLSLHYDLSNCREITLEANPDDLTPEYIKMLRTLPVNRISMGIQSFQDPLLRPINRRHTATQAIEAVNRCREADFERISIDLMYGLPGQTPELFEKDLQQAIRLMPEHISAYHLTYEEGTSLYKLLTENRIRESEEEESLLYFQLLTDTLRKAGYEHYEISNFCLPGKYAIHNSNYWKGIPYLGCGPSAHSFNGLVRQWNPPSLTEYIAKQVNGEKSYEEEWLDPDTRYNERVITSLRTRWGLSLDPLKEDFGRERYRYCMQQAAKWISDGILEQRDGTLFLTQKGIFVSDAVMSDLLWVQEE
ncbi:MAG: radical SAM family heme chaperone HemW [Bacteroides sp.]|nr:radical SAM family heme chaperone HemW [Bacteroides sp.]